MDNLERFKRIIFWSFRIMLIVTAVVSIFLGHWREAAFSIFALFCTFLPSLLEFKLEIDYPSELEIAVLLFIIGSLYLGELHEYYEKFPWWDILLHTISAMIVAGIGLSIVFVLNESKRLAFKLSPVFVCLFAFCFAVAVGTIWEIYEFAMDQIFGLNMQKSGLMDTMWDLIVDCIAALIFSIIGYFHIKRNINFFQKIEQKFFKLNPELKK